MIPQITATTSNGPQSFSTGSVTLTDNDVGVALFAVSSMKPGATGQQCIKVTYGGTLAATIKVYGTGLTATNALDTYLNIQIEEGSTSATTFPSCTGFTAAGTVFNAALRLREVEVVTGKLRLETSSVDHRRRPITVAG